LQISTDWLLIKTSTVDELSECTRCTDIDDVLMILNPKIGLPWVWEFPWDGYGNCAEFPLVPCEFCGNF